MRNLKTNIERRADRLSDGPAHDVDHQHWSRRQFLKGLGLATAGASFGLAGVPVQAFSGSSLLSRVAGQGTDRVLVLIQLTGGNDGLNTVVPINNDIYYNARPGIALSPGSTLPLTTDLGLHPGLSSVHPLFADGEMAIVQGVGYPEPVLSHFRSTDVWMTGDPVDNVGGAGWSGKHLDLAYPEFSESPPNAPLAVQIGTGTPFLFQGPSTNMGMSLASLSLFAQIAETGKVYNESGLPDTILGDEVGFMRSVANDSYRYAGSIQTAAESGQNDVEYPGSNSLASKLAIVAQLIKGRLGTSIYHVNLGGFDTHANQLARHQLLMTYIAESVSAFQQDIKASGMEEEVLVVTFSEFGRRVSQNGSGGTDHGTAAPMFVFGSGVTGGLFGEQPSLTDLDRASNVKYSTDFRSVYGSILTDWFGLPPADVAEVFGDAYPHLSIISNPTGVGVEDPVQPTGYSLEQNYPNPFNPATTISFTLRTAGSTELDIYDVAGRHVTRLIDSVLPAGRHEVLFEAGSLSSGLYVYRLKAGGQTLSKTMTLLR